MILQNVNLKAKSEYIFDPFTPNKGLEKINFKINTGILDKGTEFDLEIYISEDAGKTYSLLVSGHALGPSPLDDKGEQINYVRIGASRVGKDGKPILTDENTRLYCVIKNASIDFNSIDWEVF